MRYFIFSLIVVFLIIGAFLLIKQYHLFNSSKLISTEMLSQSNKPLKSLDNSDFPATEIIHDNLEVPWEIAFLPDGRMLVTERPGRVRIVGSDGKLNAEPVVTIKVGVEDDGEGGLLGIALHPKFEENHFVYLYYTYSSQGGETFNRVVRMKFEGDKLSEEQIIVDKISGALYHNGGRIKFGPDGFLYITTGDSQNSSFAQDPKSLAGKILRVTDDGKPAPGNPFNNLTYSYGHRNPQGIAWDSNGALWETEHGRSNPTGFDELNLIIPGKNYGWEVIQGDETRAGMETPKKNSGPNGTWAPSGAVFVGNSLFFAGLKGEALYEAVINDSQVIYLKEHLKGQFGRLREVVLGSDGMLYITTSNRDGRGSPGSKDDKIIRVNPQKLN